MSTEKMLAKAMSMLFAGLFVGCTTFNLFVGIYHVWLSEAGFLSQQVDETLRMLLVGCSGLAVGFAGVWIFFGVIGGLKEGR